MQIKIETINDLIGAMALRARQLVDLPVATLRDMHPDGMARPVKASKAECIEAILMDDFETEHGGQMLDNCFYWADSRHFISDSSTGISNSIKALSELESELRNSVE